MSSGRTSVVHLASNIYRVFFKAGLSFLYHTEVYMVGMAVRSLEDE